MRYVKSNAQQELTNVMKMSCSLASEVAITNHHLYSLGEEPSEACDGLALNMANKQVGMAGTMGTNVSLQ